MKLQAFSHHLKTPDNAKTEEKSEINNSASPITKARGSNQADLRREEMSFELAQESRNAFTGSKILWQIIPERIPSSEYASKFLNLLLK